MLLRVPYSTVIDLLLDELLQWAAPPLGLESMVPESRAMLVPAM